MKKVAMVAVVMVLALALSQQAIAAPTQGWSMAGSRANSDNPFAKFLGLFGAIWGPGNGGRNGAIWGGGAGGNHGAIWGGGAGGNHGAIWGGNGGSNHGAIWGGRDTGSTDGAIWGCKTC